MQRKGQCCGKEGVATFQRRYEGALEVARLAANLHLADGIAGASALVEPLAEKVLGLLTAPAAEHTPVQQLPGGNPSGSGSLGGLSESEADSASGSGAGSLGSRSGSEPRSGSSVRVRSEFESPSGSGSESGMLSESVDGGGGAVARGSPVGEPAAAAAVT